MNRILAIIAMCASAGCAAAEDVRAVRGLAAHVDVQYSARLRAKSELSPSSPILVRVEHPADGPQRIEFIGVVAGDFDLRNYLEREDGKPLDDLAKIGIQVVSNLPADHGADLYDSGDGGVSWRAHYRLFLWAAAGVWFLVPLAWLAVRAIRRPAATPAAAAAPEPPSVERQILDMLDKGKTRPLSVDEQGRLELLLLRHLGQAVTPGKSVELAEMVAILRDEPGSRDVVIAMERWLHSRDGGESARKSAAAALEGLRSRTLEQSATPAQEVAG